MLAATGVETVAVVQVMPRRLPLFATAARGTEELLADELTELGAARVRADRGGVRFLANPAPGGSSWPTSRTS